MKQGWVKARTSRLAVLFGILAIVVMALAAFGSATLLREQAIDDYKRQLASLTLVLAEQANKTMFSADVVLDTISEDVLGAKIQDPAVFRRRMAGEGRARRRLSARRSARQGRGRLRARRHARRCGTGA